MEATFSVAEMLFCRFPRIACTLAMVTLAAAATLQAQQASGPPQLSRRVDLKAQQLLNRTIQALGGQAFLNVKTLTTKGRIYAIRDESTAGLAPFQSYVLYPDKRRFSYGKDPPVVLINSGDKGWEIDRYGLINQPKEQLQRWIASNRYSLENLLRGRVNDPGVLIQTGGVDFVDNAPTQGIEITEAAGTNVRLDLNRQTFLPTRITYRIRNPKTGDWDEYADVYADYKMFDGIQTPMHITRYANGDRIGETFRNSVRYGEDYPANYFTPE
jgi:hypothetical protein